MYYISYILIRDFYTLLSIQIFPRNNFKSLRSCKVLLQEWFELCELWCILFIPHAICSAFHLVNPGLVSASCFWTTRAKLQCTNQTAIRSLHCRPDLWPPKPLPRPVVSPSPQPDPSWKWYYGVWIILLLFLHTVILFALSCVGVHRWCVYVCVSVCVCMRTCVCMCGRGNDIQLTHSCLV